MTFTVVTETLSPVTPRGSHQRGLLTIGHADPNCGRIDSDYIIPEDEADDEPWPCGECISVATRIVPAQADVYRERPGGAHTEAPRTQLNHMAPATVTEVIAAVRALPRGKKFSLGDVTDPLRLWATSWAKGYLDRLNDELLAGRNPSPFSFMNDMCEAASNQRTGLSVGQAKGVLNVFRAEYWKTELNRKDVTPVASPSVAKGDVHVVDGEYYRVHVAQGSGNFYAAKWNGHKFEYERGAIRLLNESNKATANQASAFGHMYGSCCYCGRDIDTPESTKWGYGPKCAADRSLPWG